MSQGLYYLRRVSALLLLAVFSLHAFAQGPLPTKNASTKSDQAGTNTASPPVTGKWTYRSFRSDPDFAVEPNDLLFGMGTLELQSSASGTLAGTLGGEGWSLNLTGTKSDTAPVMIHFRGTGTIGGEEWIYDYIGYVVPVWPNGVDQRPAIVGTIIRVTPHSGGTAPAGYVAQWIAVKQDAAVTAANAIPLIADASNTGAPIARGVDPVQQLRELETQWALAVGTNDPETIGKFFSQNFLFVGAGGVLQNRAEHLADFQTGRLKVESVELREFTAQVYEQFAVTNSRVFVKGRLGDRDITGESRFMDTWQRTNDSWLAVARQQTNVRDPASPPLPKALSVDAANVENPIMQQRAMTATDSIADSIAELKRQNQINARNRIAVLDKQEDLELPAPQRLDRARAARELLRNPPAHDATNGLLTLTVDYGTTTNIGNDPVRLRNYNGQLVGPTLRVKAGQSLKVKLINRLPAEPLGTPHNINGHHAWNTTNLHTHGLHVKPQANPGGPMPAPIESDNVLIEVPPGTEQEYSFDIPANHPAGTFWYHGHKHGSTSAHVASGMSGALIVTRNDATTNLDSVPAISAAMQTVTGRDREKIMVFQQIPYIKKPADSHGHIELANAGAMFGPNAWANSNRFTTINGQQLPVIEFAPGEVQRWRMIDSGFRNGLSLQIVKDPDSPGAGPDYINFHEIALDGLAMQKIRTTPVVDLFPGYRSDVLVEAPTTPGRYHLVDARRQVNTLLGDPEPLNFIASVIVRDDWPAVTMAFPTDAQILAQRPASLAEPDPGTPVQGAYYGLSRGFVIGTDDPGVNGAVNGNPFSMSRSRDLAFGIIQRWRIGTRNDHLFVGSPPPPPPRGPAHPFHIHVNPFEIVSIKNESGAEQLDVQNGERIWRDTVSMPPGWTIEFLTHYADFHGSFVQHCHILDHEDNGMMEKITILPPTTPVPEPIPRQLGTRQPDASQRSSATASIAVASSGNRVGSEIPPPNGKPSTVFFVKGSLCPHCMSQLVEMAKSLSGMDIDVTVVSASSEDDLKSFPDVPFRLIADPELNLFREEGAFDKEARHATIVRNRSGEVMLRQVGDEPFIDTSAVVAALSRAANAFDLAVRGTDDVADDYLTWSPTACTIRMVNGDSATGPITVTLTNDDPSANPNAGELRFATSLAPRSTATLTSITLEINPDGSPVDFFVAGVKPSTLTPESILNGGRDTNIVIRQGGESGNVLAKHAVMVRVRKALRHSSDPRPKLTDFELKEFLKAVRDLHLIDNRFEWYVRMHRLATGHGRDIGSMIEFGLPWDPDTPVWPDQAHAGSGFIAWHRAFLLQFERELQRRYPYVALPYWAQGTNQTFFAEDRLGEAADSGDVVRFLPGSPLYGWSISLSGDRGVTTTPMGLLRRRALNHNDPNIANYRQWLDFASFADVDLFARTLRRVEVNPHNNGHGTVGPDGIWMTNCRESNADPVFYVFHCNHDYLWAKWQYEMDRFLNDGSDSSHYSPPDAFIDAMADKRIPLGHHLKDTMWPWDGTTNQVVTGQIWSNRPNLNDFGPFPASPLPQLWPGGFAQPTPSDMIDYEGYVSRSSDLGFCYDGVPFGARLQPLVAMETANEKEEEAAHRVAVAVISDRTANSDTRLLAIRSIPSSPGKMAAEFASSLKSVVADQVQSPTLRSEALDRWIAQEPAEAFRKATQLMTDDETPLSLRLSALKAAAREIHFSDVPHLESHAVLDKLRAVLQNDSPAPLRAAAVRQLAPSADRFAKNEIIGAIESTTDSDLRLEEAVALLRFFPEEKERIRAFISSENDAVVVAAIQSLFADPESIDLRRQLVRDKNRSIEARKAAIQSLIHEGSDELTSFLIDLAADENVELQLREESLAAASVRLRKQVKGMSVEAKTLWSDRLRAIQASESTLLGSILRDSVSVVAK